MKKIVKYSTLATASIVTSLIPLAARAEDMMSSTDTTSTATDAVNTASNTTASGVAMGALFGGLIILWIVLVGIAIAFFIFWILMLVDCVKRTNWKQESDKNLWLIILIAGFVIGLSWIAALVYYFAVKRELDAPKKKK